MNVFISWSGERSLHVAEALRDWLPKVIQSVKPWISANDIEKGARWATDIAEQLQKSRFGIICLTAENLDSRWLNFEAGAISKTVSSARLCPYLLDIESTGVEGPLAQFQATRATRDETLRMLEAINSSFDIQPLTPTQLTEAFDDQWPKLEQKLKSVPPITVPTPRRDDRELLMETLTTVRELANLYGQLDRNVKRLPLTLRIEESRLPFNTTTLPLKSFVGGVEFGKGFARGTIQTREISCPYCAWAVNIILVSGDDTFACPSCLKTFTIVRGDDGEVVTRKKE